MGQEAVLASSETRDAGGPLPSASCSAPFPAASVWASPWGRRSSRLPQGCSARPDSPVADRCCFSTVVEGRNPWLPLVPVLRVLKLPLSPQWQAAGQARGASRPCWSARSPSVRRPGTGLFPGTAGKTCSSAFCCSRGPEASTAEPCGHMAEQCHRPHSGPACPLPHSGCAFYSDPSPHSASCCQSCPCRPACPWALGGSPPPRSGRAAQGRASSSGSQCWQQARALELPSVGAWGVGQHAAPAAGPAAVGRARLIPFPCWAPVEALL